MGENSLALLSSFTKDLIKIKALRVKPVSILFLYPLQVQVQRRPSTGFNPGWVLPVTKE